ncbi:hypothetical protein LOY24_06970 [Pseudomonas putida]|uniref:hypothetical protein n=1 Tax=Pseudomonas putida TaxID=303 RepID=UPI00215F1744|nr:hypothetical protein [Pseudomonas putida]UVL79878.1 hypothetical protein LOY24_06970 [Pseudomonas putida]
MNTKLKATAAILLSLSLFGCGSGEEKSAEAPKVEKTVNTYAIVLPTGDTLNATGENFREYDRDSSGGKIKNYEVSSNSIAKTAENSVYTQLKNLGFKRSVMEDSAAQFKVHYKKDGSSTIGAIYTESGESSAPVTKMKMYFSES